MKASRRARIHADLAADDTAVLQVLEAILAAMILLSAILFVTISSSPVRETGAAGISLSTLAADTLTVLEKQPGPSEPGLTRLEYEVNRAIRGETDSVERFLDTAVPQGTRYALRLDNGVEPLQLVPAAGASFATPRAASGAATYVLANWTQHAPATPTCSFVPGEELLCDDDGDGTATQFNFSAWTDLYPPSGNTSSDQAGPGNVDWLDLWKEDDPTGETTPAWVPYGVWRCGGCPDIPGGEFRVVLEDGTAVDRQLYTVQLLLWDGV